MNGIDINFYLRLAWIFTGICWVLALFSRYNPLPKRGGLGQPLPNPIGLIASVICFVPFSGLRTNIGDTYYYVKDFKEFMPDGHIDFNIGSETLYPLIADIVKETADDYRVVLMIMAIISLVPVLFILYKYSHPFDMSIFLFMAMGYFASSMNGMRQYAATGIAMLGTKYLFSEKKSAIIKYSVIVLLAWSMHSTAWVLFVIYFFSRRKAWKPSSFMLLFFCLVVLSLFDLILPSFLGALEGTAQDGYATSGWFTNGQEGGSNFIRVLVAVVPLVLAYFARDRMRQLGSIGDILINIGFLNAAFFIISTYNWIFARLAVYTSVYFIMLTSWVVYNGTRKKDRALYYGLFVIAFYYYSTFLSFTLQNYTSETFFPHRVIFYLG